VSEAPTNKELVARGYAAWNEDDLEGLLALCHPEVSYHTSGVFPGLDPVYEARRGSGAGGATSTSPGSGSR
jgi:ketosteroid isomerase-like protein